MPVLDFPHFDPVLRREPRNAETFPPTSEDYEPWKAA